MGLLRFLLAMSVVMTHITKPTYFSGFSGINAVEVFFLVSGFYIALILDKSYTSTSHFFINRFLKIYPAYWIISVLVLLRSLLDPALRNILFNFPTSILTWGWFSNLTLIGSDWLMCVKYQGDRLLIGNLIESDLPLWQLLWVPQAWSIGIEITFYLLAPILVRQSTLRLLLSATLLLILRLAVSVLGTNQDPWNYRFFPFELPLFLGGILLYRHRENLMRLSSKLLPHFNANAFLLASYLVFGYVNYNYQVNRGIQMLFLILLTTQTILRSRTTKFDTWLGDLAYPIYISHLFVESSYSMGMWYAASKFQQLTPLNGEMPLLTAKIILILLFALILSRVVLPLERVRSNFRK